MALGYGPGRAQSRVRGAEVRLFLTPTLIGRFARNRSIPGSRVATIAGTSISLRRRTARGRIGRGGITAYLGSTSCWPLWQVSLRVRQWRRCMTGPQIRDLHNALSSAYDLHTLEEMLRCCLDKSLEQVAGSGSLRKVLYNL